MMRKLLITGFDPFGGASVNPAWQAVSLLPDIIGDFEVHKLPIPTVFGKAADLIMETADILCPDVILCIGQAGGRDAVTSGMPKSPTTKATCQRENSAFPRGLLPTLQRFPLWKWPRPSGMLTSPVPFPIPPELLCAMTHFTACCTAMPEPL